MADSPPDEKNGRPLEESVEQIHNKAKEDTRKLIEESDPRYKGRWETLLDEERLASISSILTDINYKVDSQPETIQTSVAGEKREFKVYTVNVCKDQDIGSIAILQLHKVWLEKESNGDLVLFLFPILIEPEKFACTIFSDASRKLNSDIDKVSVHYLNRHLTKIEWVLKSDMSQFDKQKNIRAKQRQLRRWLYLDDFEPVKPGHNGPTPIEIDPRRLRKAMEDTLLAEDIDYICRDMGEKLREQGYAMPRRIPPAPGQISKRISDLIECLRLEDPDGLSHLQVLYDYFGEEEGFNKVISQYEKLKDDNS